MLIRDLTYQFPKAAYLLFFLILIIFLYTWLFYYRRSILRQYAPPETLSQLLLPRSLFFRNSKLLCLHLCWIFSVLALMDPIGNFTYLPLEQTTVNPKSKKSGSFRYRSHTVIILIDSSASMNTPDGRNHQTRLNAAKEIAEEFISQLKGENVALYAFTSDLIPLVPPTLDYLFTRLQLKELHINEGESEGTNFSRVLSQLKMKLPSPPVSGLYTVILLSDGGDNEIESLQEKARETAIEKISELIPNPKERNLRLFTIGMGSKTDSLIPHVTFKGKPVKSKLEEDILKSLAYQERGAYYEASSIPVWNLVQDILNRMKQDPLYEENGKDSFSHLERKFIPINQEDVSYDLYYQIPLALSLISLLFYLILPDTRL
jgi:Ca-activated chloride channel family protein